MPNMNTVVIESLRSFATSQGELAFAHLCTAALEGEEWAVERVRDAFADIGAEVFHQYRSRATEEIEAIALVAIRDTITTRPDGAIPRSFQP